MSNLQLQKDLIFLDLLEQIIQLLYLPLTCIDRDLSRLRLWYAYSETWEIKIPSLYIFLTKHLLISSFHTWWMFSFFNPVVTSTVLWTMSMTSVNTWSLAFATVLWSRSFVQKMDKENETNVPSSCANWDLFKECLKQYCHCSMWKILIIVWLLKSCLKLKAMNPSVSSYCTAGYGFTIYC